MLHKPFFKTILDPRFGRILARHFLVLLLFESNYFLKLSKGSSKTELSNHMDRSRSPLRKNHLDPFWATFHSDDVIVGDLPCQMARIRSFWVEKCNNKNDPIFSDYTLFFIRIFFFRRGSTILRKSSTWTSNVSKWFLFMIKNVYKSIKRLIFVWI